MSEHSCKRGYWFGEMTSVEKAVVLGELRAENKRKREDPSEGHYCVVCDQRCKRYKRKLYAAPCRALIALYEMTLEEEQEESVHTSSSKKEKFPCYVFQTRDIYRRANIVNGLSCIMLLGYFGLATMIDRGFWAITTSGKEFVLWVRDVPKYALLYNDTVEGFSDDEGEVGIVEALGEQFDYHDLMSR